jgi:hypothetical protein
VRRRGGGLSFVTALVLALRLHGAIPAEFYGTPASQKPEIPSCCH